jgi:hypothetical protein
MEIININEDDYDFIDHFRMALSAETHAQRLKAVQNVKHHVVAVRLAELSNEEGHDWPSDPRNTELSQWVSKTTTLRQEAAYELSRTNQEFEAKNGRRLSFAEHVGLVVFMSIQDKKFKGLYTPRGILRQAQEEARATNVAGARDKDTLRDIWTTYRGVVHLGMAIHYCDDNPTQNHDVLQLAELFRQHLSENCPKGTSKPYVDPREKICFVYLSSIWGPRFQNRGLSFDVD